MGINGLCKLPKMSRIELTNLCSSQWRCQGSGIWDTLAFNGFGQIPLPLPVRRRGGYRASPWPRQRLLPLQQIVRSSKCKYRNITQSSKYGRCWWVYREQTVPAFVVAGFCTAGAQYQESALKIEAFDCISVLISVHQLAVFHDDAGDLGSVWRETPANVA